MIKSLMDCEAGIMRKYRQGTYKSKIAKKKAIEYILDQIVCSYRHIKTPIELKWVCRAINRWVSILRSDFRIYKLIPYPSSKEFNLSEISTEPPQPLRHFNAAAMFGTLNIEALRKEYGDPPFL